MASTWQVICMGINAKRRPELVYSQFWDDPHLNKQESDSLGAVVDTELLVWVGVYVLADIKSSNNNLCRQRGLNVESLLWIHVRFPTFSKSSDSVDS